jgi:arginine N-succinyltransferase
MAMTGDLNPLVALAMRPEGGMTTMPKDPEHMAERIAEVTASVDPTRAIDGREVYLFVLDEAEEAGYDVVGMSAVYAAVGLDRPFYSYKITKVSKYSPDIDRRFDYTILQPSNDYTGCTEVGTLYLPPERRGQGRGRMLSLARFMFLAVHRERFGEVVMAEMRGWINEDGRSPFWDAVGQKFFGLEFDQADRLSSKEFRFMQDMLPGTPIHVDLLPKAAIEVISRPHKGSEPAAAMLRRLGMRDHGYIDIFDAGLCLDAFIDDIDVVRRARRRRVRITSDVPAGQSGLVANTQLASFTIIEAQVTHDETQPLTAEQAAALGVTDGDTIVTYIFEVPRD